MEQRRWSRERSRLLTELVRLARASAGEEVEFSGVQKCGGRVAHHLPVKERVTGERERAGTSPGLSCGCDVTWAEL